MDIVANVHYGFVGSEVGISDLELYVGAGIAQQRSGDREKGRWYAFGDEPVDQRAIAMGIELSERYGTDFSREQFLALFHQYVSRGAFDDYIVTNP